MMYFFSTTLSDPKNISVTMCSMVPSSSQVQKLRNITSLFPLFIGSFYAWIRVFAHWKYLIVLREQLKIWGSDWWKCAQDNDFINDMLYVTQEGLNIEMVKNHEIWNIIATLSTSIAINLTTVLIFDFSLLRNQLWY